MALESVFNDLLKNVFNDSLNKIRYEIRDKIKDFKIKEVPSTLYRYCSVNEYSKKSIKDGYIYLCPPQRFNDPYEGYLALTNGVNNKMEEAIKKMEKTAQEEGIDVQLTHECIQESINAINRNRDLANSLLKSLLEIIDTHIACFTEDYRDILMWSHYANNHKGICIAYDTSEIEKHLYQVMYSDEIFDLNKIFEVYKDLNLSDGDALTCGINFAYTIKFSQWIYENEWRLIETEERYNIKPKAIYVGAQITVDDKEEIMNLCKDGNIPLHQMIMDNEEYKLVDEEICCTDNYKAKIISKKFIEDKATAEDLLEIESWIKDKRERL